MALDPLTAVMGLGDTLIRRFFPDPAERDKAKLALADMVATGELAEFTSRAGIITAEAKSDNWITASWRPLTMLIFVALIAAHWLGFTAPNLGEAERLALLEIVKVGLGGYVIGRSAEKGIKAWKEKQG